MTLSILILFISSLSLLTSLAFLACFKNPGNLLKILCWLTIIFSVIVLSMRHGGGDTPYYLAIIKACKEGTENLAIRKDLFTVISCQLANFNIDPSLVSAITLSLPFISIFYVANQIYGKSTIENQQKYVFLLCILGLALPGYFMSLIRFSIAVFLSYLIIVKKSNMVSILASIGTHYTGVVFTLLAYAINKFEKFKKLFIRFLNLLTIQKKFLLKYGFLILTSSSLIIIFSSQIIEFGSMWITGHILSLSGEGLQMGFSIYGLVFLCVLTGWTIFLRKELNLLKLVFMFTTYCFIFNSFFGRFSLISYVLLSDATAKYLSKTKNSILRLIILFGILVPFLTFKSYYGYISDKEPYSTIFGLDYSEQMFSNSYESDFYN